MSRRMRGDLVGLRQRRQGERASARQHFGTVGASAEAARRLPARTSGHQCRRRGARKHRHRAAIATGAADLGFAAEHALPDSVERFLFSEDRLMLVASRRSDLAGRRQIDFVEVTGRDFVGLTASTALQVHISKHAARLGPAPAVPGPVARFRRDLPDGRRRRRHRRGAGSRGQTLRARDADRDDQDPRSLGQPQARRSAPAASRRCRGRPSNWWSICARRWRERAMIRISVILEEREARLEG